MALRISDLPLDTPLKKKPGPNKDQIRAKAAIIVAAYDVNQYAVGIKRGIRFVKKFIVDCAENGDAVSAKDVEQEVRAMLSAGDFDKELFEVYETIKPGRKSGARKSAGKKRGRPKMKSVAKKSAGKRGRPPKKSAGKRGRPPLKATARRGRPPKKAAGRRGRPPKTAVAASTGKRRGRPPRKASFFPSGKRRGRPPKNA